MDRRRLGEDEAGELSETAAVGVLVAITLVMTLSAGLYVFAADSGADTPVANFSYDYSEASDELLVTYVDGQGPPAGEVVFEAGERSASWTELSGMQPNASLEESDLVRLSPDGTWGRPITDATEVRVYLGTGVNRTQISQWNTSL